MLYIIGIGLCDPTDITVKGLEIIKKCERIYLESYTSILTVKQKDLEKFYDRPITIADRELVETNPDDIFTNAETQDVAFLVIGDPFAATTHTDLILRARDKGIQCKIIHNASIINAVGCCGLQLYSYGQTVSIPYWNEVTRSDAFYDKIADNRNRGLHTLCLLDIRVKEPTLESLCSKTRRYEPPQFMTVAQASKQLIEILEYRVKDAMEIAFNEGSMVVGLARVGSDDQRIVACSLKEMSEMDLGPPLHCLVIPAKKLHFMEYDYLIKYAKNADEFAQMVKQ